MNMNASKLLGQSALNDHESNKAVSFQSKTRKVADSAQAKSALADFQGLMVNMMLQSMRSTVKKGELFNGGQAEEVFQSMLDQEYSKQASGSDVLNLDREIRKMYKLPVNETFAWEHVEELPEGVDKQIVSDLGFLDTNLVKDFKSKESDSARATKTLNHFSKKKDLEKWLPQERLSTLDTKDLEAWQKERDDYLSAKGIDQRYGEKLNSLNKSLLEMVYPELKQNNIEARIQKTNGLQAYKALSEAK